MGKYVYPAVLTMEDDGGVSVEFPDLESCYTCGDDLADALMMAEDVLALTMYEYEKEGKPIPEPSDQMKLFMEYGTLISMVAADTIKYQKRYNNKFIKKTITIPEWLDEAATSMGINFSQTMREALLRKTGM